MKESVVKNFPVLVLLFVACGLFTVSGCNQSLPGHAHNGSENGLSGKLTITGSSTVAPLVGEIAKRFEENNPAVRVDVQSGGSGKGIADARQRIVNIGMASRDLKPDEDGLIAHRIAADGVGLIVNQSNQVNELTESQVVGLYTGRYKNWKELGGADLPVIVVHKAEGRATLEVFLKHFRLTNPQVKADVIVGDNEHGVKTVANTKGAIGYVSIGTAEADIEIGHPIRLLPLRGVAASSENVANGSYPMSRFLNLVMPSQSDSDLEREFVNYCQSEDVHDIVVTQYFVPIDD